MSFSVYIPINKKDGNLYVGCTTDPETRLALHNQGQVESTKDRRPLELIHSEQFENKGDAFNRERYLKSL